MRRPHALLVLVMLVPVTVTAQSDFLIEVEETSIVEMSSGVVRILMTNVEPLAGWSYGMCHDNSVLTILEVNPGEAMMTINDGDGPDFYAIDLLEADGGYTVGVVGFGAGLGHLDAGTSQEIELPLYGTDVPAPAFSTVEPCGTLGDPVVDIIFIEWLTGIAHIPDLLGATISVVEPQFRRGDVDGSGTLTLVDPIYELNALFVGELELTCDDAADINDDGILQLDDPIALLNALFLGGPAPLPPFPECGADPTTDALGCEGSQDCP